MNTIDEKRKEEVRLDFQLFEAIEEGDIDEVMRLLDVGAAVNADNHIGLPLIKAVQCDLHQIVEYLLFRGADPALEDDDGLIAIDYACNWWMLAVLLSHGSKPSFKGGRVSLSDVKQALEFLWSEGCEYDSRLRPKFETTYHALLDAPLC